MPWTSMHFGALLFILHSLALTSGSAGAVASPDSDGTVLLQTHSLVSSSAPLAPEQGGHAQLGPLAQRHIMQVRQALVVFLVVVILGVSLWFSNVGWAIYNRAFVSGKDSSDATADRSPPMESAMGRFAMQTTALSWKNAKISMRRDSYASNSICTGCCLQLATPVLYIALLTLVPSKIMQDTGASKLVKVEHPKQYGRDYTEPKTWVNQERSLRDYLFEEPSMTLSTVPTMMRDPLQLPWHPFGSPPQGACFCRTLGIVGPRAEEFRAHLEKVHADWQAQSPKNIETMFNSMMLGDLREKVCPARNKAPIFRVFKSQEEAISMASSYQYGSVDPNRSATMPLDRLCGIVAFDNDPLTEAVPRYLVRTNVTGLDPTGHVGQKTVNDDVRGIQRFALGWYLQSGFLALQDEVQNWVAQVRLGRELNLPSPNFVPLPSDPYTVNTFKQSLAALFGSPSAITTTFASCIMLISYMMIRERTSRQKELMRLMGLYDSSLAFSWVLLFGVQNIIASLGCAILVFVIVVEKSDFFVLFTIFYLCSMATVVVGMVFSALISSDRLGALVAFGVYYTLGLVYYGLEQGLSSFGLGELKEDTHASTPMLYLASLIPNVAFALCMKTYFTMEMSYGCTWQSMWRHVKGYSVVGGIFMLIFDFFFFGLLYLYLDQVVQHEVGTVRPVYFPFTLSFWKELFGIAPASQDENGAADNDDKDDANNNAGVFFEKENSVHQQQLRNRNSVISVRNLKRVFTSASGAIVQAIDGLNVTMYEGECFCLLGHNGAGKTTTMAVITGMLHPTAGKVRVLGKRMPEEKLQVRHNMGFCMQQNVLWDTLTVEEHIQLFGALMGLSYQATMISCDKVLAKVELLSKRHAQAMALSGGMKRKLNVALALLGDSRVVVLDEPTAGMDPYTRHQLWGVLKGSRHERIMCLTTHYMDEADELGDRVCVMVHGRAACCGTNSFLKRQLGCGYMLNIVKLAEEVANAPIEKLVKQHCGEGVCQASSNGRELRLRVPFVVAASFPALMKELDEKSALVGIETYGVGISDLEDVFLRVANGDEVVSAAVNTSGGADNKSAPPLRRTGQIGTPSQAPRTARKAPSFSTQFSGLLQRRARYCRRDPRMFCCQVLMPIIMMVVFLTVSKVFKNKYKEFGKIEVDSRGWEPSAGTGFANTLVSVGSPEGTDNPVANAWNLSSVSSVRRVNLNASLFSTPNQYRNSRRNLQEVAFADSAYATAHAPRSLPQFGGVLYAPDRITIFPNTSAQHAAPALFNLHFTAMLAAAKDGTNALPERMELSSLPLQPTASEKLFFEGFNSFGMGLTIMTAHTFISTGIAAYISMEKEMEVKHQLMVSGVGRVAYWSSNFLFDSFFGIVGFISTSIILAIFGSEYWFGAHNVQATVTLLLLFTPAVTAFSYFMSQFYSTAGGAIVGVLCFGLFVGGSGVEVAEALNVFPSTRRAGMAVLWLTRLLLPSACVGHGLMQLALWKDFSTVMKISPFNGWIFGTQYCSPLLGKSPCVVNAGDDCAMLVVDAVVYMFLAFLVDTVRENPRAQKWLRLRSDPKCPEGMRRKEEPHLRAEVERVAKLDPASQVIVLDDVYKTYGDNVHAVRGITYAVEGGQVFGLLGANGAGKTTTFKMMCGQLAPSHGCVYVQGKDVTKNVDSVREQIGYCPQFDALLDLMTVKEHLELYSQVKGFSGAEKDREVEGRLRMFHLEEFEGSRANQLSGGNKRKLSCALALIGEPEVIFLDEPSAGMDPVVRRFMWDVIQSIAQRRKSSAVILTTHSMDEADALCSRIAIQCSGQIRCLGGPQQLKEWYGTGLELNVRLETPLQADVQEVCGKWEVSPAEECNTARATELVEQYCRQGKKQPGWTQKAPISGHAGSISTGALSEWCLLQDRAHGVRAFLADICGQESVSCVECAAGSLRFRLVGACSGGGPLPYGDIFSLLGENSNCLQLVDFQLSQGTLEQTFNRLVAEDLQVNGELVEKEQGR